MNRLRKFFYSITVAAIIAAVGVFVAACSDKQDSKPAPDYTIRLMLNADAEYESYTGKAGSAVVFDKGDPTRVNAVFDGWSLQPNGEVTELPTVMPAENVSYYAIFSRRYTITLRVGEGELTGSDKLSVKADQNLYDLVKEITPSAPGVSVFDAWYYGSRKIDADSTVTMPASSITLEARYNIGFKLNVYKEGKFGHEDYTSSAADSVSGTGFVGSAPRDSEYPNFVGYELNTEKSGSTSLFVLNADGNNNFDVYYSLIGCNIIFNANPPENTEPSGRAMSDEWGYNEENSVPDCGYTISGYRFSHWSTTADDTGAKYYAGSNLSVTDTTTLFAIWSKGYTDFNEVSNDVIYLDKDANGTTKIYLQRLYLDEVEGELNETTGVFSFKDENNSVISRGRLDKATETYICINSDKYSLRTYEDPSPMDSGVISSSIGLEISDDGSAVYKDTVKNLNIVGTYAIDGESGSMKFVPNNSSESEEFYFRLAYDKNEQTGVTRNIFEIRGDEYGAWQNLSYKNEIDEHFRLIFDGYGNAAMVALDAVGSNSNVTYGVYRYTADSTDALPEIVIAFLSGNSVANIRGLTVVLKEGEYGTAEKPYNRVYVSNRGEYTFYSKPSDGSLPDTATADKFVLDGYGVFDNSALYTANGVTTEGKYILDTESNTFTFIPKNGDSVNYEITYKTEGEGETAQHYYLYEAAESICKDYAVGNLENYYIPGNVYRFRIMNNGKAMFSVRVTMSDATFGCVIYSYIPVIEGEYSAVEGSDGEYVFTAPYDINVVLQIYNMYYQAYQRPLNISNFYNFKFKFDNKVDDNGYATCTATAMGDDYKDYSVVYDGVTYTMDGYGKAVGTDGAGKTFVKDYVVTSAMGLPYMYLRWDSGKVDSDGNTIYDQSNYILIDGAFVGIENDYAKFNNRYLLESFGDGFFRMVVLENGKAVLYYAARNGGVARFYSYGEITWNDADKKFGSYREIECLNTAGSILIAQYGDFKFGTKIVKSDKDEDIPTFYIYDSEFVSNEAGSVTVGGANGTELIINLNENKAEYRQPKEEGGYTSIAGDMTYHDGVVSILYTFTKEEDGLEYISIKAFKLKYNVDHTAVTSFIEIGQDREVGLWQDEDGTNDYIYLSGETNTDGKYIGIYYQYVEPETKGDDYKITAADYVAHNGFYKRTSESSVREFEFTYDVTTEDENGEDQTVSMTSIFRVTYGSTYMPEYKMRTMYFGQGVYVYSGLTGTQPIGILAGGGYSAITYMTSSGSTYTGKVGVYNNPNLLFVEGMYLYEFRVNDSALFYFSATVGDTPRVVMLDGIYSSENFGMFTCTQDRVIKDFPVYNAPENEGDEPSYTPTDITVKQLWLNGLGYARLITADDKMYTVFYIAIDNTTYQLYTVIDESVRMFGTYRLYRSENSENPFIAVFADDEMRKTFSGSNGSSFVTDGFSSAAYVDEKGIYHSGIYERVADHPEVIEVSYIGTNGALTVTVFYLEVKSDGTFEVLDGSDPRIPTDENNGSEAA